MWNADWLSIEHTPSGMTARADFGRSSVKRRDACKSVLRGKLWHLENGANEKPATDAQLAIAARILAGRK